MVSFLVVASLSERLFAIFDITFIRFLYSKGKESVNMNEETLFANFDTTPCYDTTLEKVYHSFPGGLFIFNINILVEFSFDPNLTDCSYL